MFKIQTHYKVAAVFLFVLTLSVLSGVKAHAATPPDICFNFNSGTGTIEDYYDYEDNDSLNPACTRDVDIPATISGTPVTIVGEDAFRDKTLTSVTIPNSATVIGKYAFNSNLITSVVIPNSVTIIEVDAFSQNLLTSLTLGNSVSTIEDAAFAGNQLTIVNIPNSVSTIEPVAFVGNSSLDSYTTQAMFTSGDPAQVQQVYDSIRLVRLFTADPSNPNNLQDSILTEAGFVGMDLNGNGNQDDVMGGHLINPVDAGAEVVSSSNVTGSSLASTGQNATPYALASLTMLTLATGAITLKRFSND